MSGRSGDSKEQARRNLALRRMQEAEQAGEADFWRDEARCALPQYDVEAWFPEQGSGGIGAVRQVCMGCPVRMSCLAYAIKEGRNCYGVWGGYTHDERRKYLNWRRRQTTNAQ
jgi:WhiB family redox-sensing transcriptional regulator